MTPLDLITAIVWLASVVEVGSFTYESFKNTYQPFPGISSGGNQQGVPGAPITSATQLAGPAAAPPSRVKARPGSSGMFGGITDAIINAVTGGGEGPSNAERARLSNLRTPPPNLQNAVIAAARGRGDKANAANAFQAWALANGWKVNDVSAQLEIWGVRVF